MIPIVLDMDTGIDDAIALAYAVASDELAVVGVVGTYGNVDSEVAVLNTLDVLHLCESDDVPVYRGSSHALGVPVFHRSGACSRIHGENGIGNVHLQPAPKGPEEEDGVSFLLEAIRRYGRALVVVTTGPLTDLALALQREPDLAQRVGTVVAMGGALAVRGNATSFAEANILQDPVAAKLVMERGLPLVMVGLDVTRRTCLALDDVGAWRASGSARGRAFADMLQYYIANTPGDGVSIHDPSALVRVVHPSFFTSFSFPLTVETEGKAIGRTVAEVDHVPESKKAVEVCLDVDGRAVERELETSLESLFSR